jgi:hypothetical protein
MTITDPLSFCGNVIGFMAVAAKTVFDLLINPYFFRKGETTLGLLNAAARKRTWGDITTAWTFFVVGIGYTFSIAALIRK